MTRFPEASHFATEPELLSPPPRSSRLDNLDFLRGLVMVVMALDHIRGFLTNAPFDPVDPTKTTAAYFFTRWITHFCAPVFVFLAGTGAYLAGSRGKSRTDLSAFLFTRGLWLILLEFTVVRFTWSFTLVYNDVVVMVIGAIGASMVILSILVYLPLSAITTIGVAIVALHNATDKVRPDTWGADAWIWQLLHAGGAIKAWDGFTVYVPYPILAWAGVMICGYGFGAMMQLPGTTRRSQLVGLGLALTLLFVGLRATNVYGDPHPWSVQERGPLATTFSFLNCHKYPPSLLFLLMTLGPAIVLLAVMPERLGRAGQVIVTFGRVPLFYYVLHFALAHAVAVGLALATYGRAGWLIHGVQSPRPEDYGYGLPVIYLVWVGIVVGLYFPCRWFAGVKQRRRDWWLSYV